MKGLRSGNVRRGATKRYPTHDIVMHEMNAIRAEDPQFFLQ